MSFQIAVRLPDELWHALDALVASGRFATRADAVRHAVEDIVERERRRREGEQIVEGYRRVPQTADELAATTAAAIRSINDEPW